MEARTRGAGTPTAHAMQVTHSLAVGGSEMLAAAIAEAGVRQGIRMSICALNCGGGLEASLGNAGVRTHVIARRPGFQPRLLVELTRLFRKERATVVLTHHFGQLLYSALGSRLAGARLIHIEHEYYSVRSARSRRLLRLAAALAERVVGVTEEVVRFLVDEAKLPPQKVCLVRNGVDLERFRPRVGPACQELHLAPGRPVVGTVGRLDPAKDQRSLIRAFRAVVAEVPGAVLVIIGEGPMRRELERDVERHGLAENVRFLGERFDVPALLPCLDVFVLSSVHEGLPLALLEAMACARPVVVTDVGGVAPVVDRGQAGVVVPAGDVHALAQAIAGLLRDPAHAARLGTAARAIVAARYDLKSTIDTYLGLCRGPLGSLPASSEYSARPDPGRR